MQSNSFLESHKESKEKEGKSEWFLEGRFDTMDKERRVVSMKKVISWCMGIAAGTALVVVLLITAFEVAMYSDFGYYEREYEKYDVLSDLDMEMKDVMHVTKEMMAYLRGDRDELSVMTTVEGIRQDFFNEQDRFHMGEVQALFTGGMQLRLAAGIVLAVSVAGLMFLNGKVCLQILCRSYRTVLGVFVILLTGLGILVVRDFNTVFVKFHELFFDNDLWIFDPAEDFMIRMLPEGLFYDFVIRIGLIFTAGLVLFFVLSIVFQKTIRNTYE